MFCISKIYPAPGDAINTTSVVPSEVNALEETTTLILVVPNPNNV